MMSIIPLTRAHFFLDREVNKIKIIQLVMLLRNCKALHYNPLAHGDYPQKKQLKDDLSTVAMEALFYFCTIQLL